MKYIQYEMGKININKKCIPELYIINECTFKFMPSSIFHKHVNVLSLVTAFSLYYKIIMQVFIKADRH